MGWKSSQWITLGKAAVEFAGCIANIIVDLSSLVYGMMGHGGHKDNIWKVGRGWF